MFTCIRCRRAPKALSYTTIFFLFFAEDFPLAIQRVYCTTFPSGNPISTRQILAVRAAERRLQTALLTVW